MSLFSSSKAIKGLVSLAAVLIGAVLALSFSLDSNPQREQGPIAPGISLVLTAEARQSLQQSGSAFPSNDAGFSAYYRVPDGSGGYFLDKAAVDQALFNDPTPTQRRSGPGILVDIGGGHSVASVPIRNIDGLITDVNLYYDDQGWLVAYFPAGAESSRAWQANRLNTENPVLTDLSQTTLLDAINDVLVEALGQQILAPNDLDYYHWRFPTATDFLMIGTARGLVGVDTVSFAVPSSFSVQEVSVSMWISETNQPCARTLLDGVSITDWCDRSFLHGSPNLTDFNSRSVHQLQLEHYNQDVGASGAMVMLVYSVN